MYEGKEFKKHCNNCNESKNWEFAVMSLIINNYDGKKDLKQDSSDFFEHPKVIN